jgi:hypothetical protein
VILYHQLPLSLHEEIRGELFSHSAYTQQQKQILQVLSDGDIKYPPFKWMINELEAWCSGLFGTHITPYDLVVNYHLGDEFFFDWHTDYYDGQLPYTGQMGSQQISMLYYPHTHKSFLLLKDKHENITKVPVDERRVVFYPSDTYHKVEIVDAATMRVSVPFIFWIGKEQYASVV